MPNGHLVSRISDYIIYSVEAGMIERVVAMYGPCMLLSSPYASLLEDVCEMLTVGGITTKSYQGRCHCGWADVVQGARTGGIR